MTRIATPGRVTTALLGLVLTLGPHVVGAQRPVASASSRPASRASDPATQVPSYEWDPAWPKPLPNNWVLGPVAGLAVDAREHVWIVHRIRSSVVGTQTECCLPAPAVIEFDQAGNVVQAWGGPRPEVFDKSTTPSTPGSKKLTWTPPTDYTWPDTEYGVYVDHKDNLWLGNYGGSHVLKLTRQGKLVLQIGRTGATALGSNDTTAMSGPTGITVDPKTNEVYVADGYTNRRVIVFDAETGAYRRHWGAYGKRPDDAVPIQFTPGPPHPTQFTTIRCAVIDKDDLVWTCDRGNSRIQVFRKDGTFVREVFIPAPKTGAEPITLGVADGKGGTVKTPVGSAFDLAFSRDAQQRFVFVADGRSEKIWILRRSDMKMLGSFGQPGHWPGAFTLVHNVALDSKNNLYVTESSGGSRVQRFLYKGLKPGTAN